MSRTLAPVALAIVVGLAAIGWLKLVHDPQVRREAAWRASLDSSRTATEALARSSAARDAALADTIRALRVDSAAAHGRTVAAARAADSAIAAVRAVTDTLVPRRLVDAALAADSGVIAGLRGELAASAALAARWRSSYLADSAAADSALALARKAQGLAASAPRGRRCGLGAAAGVTFRGGGALVVGVACAVVPF